MNAALELVRAGPTARPLFLVGVDRPRARDAPDRPIAHVVQQVVRNLVDLNIGPNSLLVPVRERMDLPDAVALRPFELRRLRPARRLVPADAGDPGVVGLERAQKRLDLPDVAAAVGVALPQVRALGAMLLGDRRDLRLQQLQAVALDEPPARLVRLAEEEVRVELD